MTKEIKPEDFEINTTPRFVNEIAGEVADGLRVVAMRMEGNGQHVVGIQMCFRGRLFVMPLLDEHIDGFKRAIDVSREEAARRRAQE